MAPWNGPNNDDDDDDDDVQALRSVINDNALTQACPRTTGKTAVMLAEHCDKLLGRSRQRSAADQMHDDLDDVVSPSSGRTAILAPWRGGPVRAGLSDRGEGSTGKLSIVSSKCAFSF